MPRLTVVASGLSCCVCSGYEEHGHYYVEHELYYIASQSSRCSYAVCRNCGSLYEWRRPDALAQ